MPSNPTSGTPGGRLTGRRRRRAPVAAAGTMIGASLGMVLVPAALGSAPDAAAAPAYVTDPAGAVNPFIGTTNGGDTFPGADAPLGMIQWSPDTTNRPDGGGYDYNSKSIIGYSLTHLSGPGCRAEGDIPILPTAGAVGTDPGGTTEPLDHSQETATPGYYQLNAGGVDTQLTTTTRSGMAQFGFPSGSATGNLLFKLSDSQTRVTASTFKVVSPTEVAGSVTTGYFCGARNTYTLYFDMVFNRPFASTGSWTTGGTGDYVSFDTASNRSVQAKVGISYVSAANAALNRSTEDPGWDFPTVRSAAHQAWNRVLDRIQVAGGSADHQAVFYTALYHSLMHPNVFSDVNGQYMGFDGKVHTVASPQTAQYANYSGWDIYRSAVELEAVVAPRRTSDIVSSMLNDYAQSGQFPKWAENNGESYVMVGDPADGIIAGAYAFGATNFDTGQALADMQAEADNPNNIRPGLSYYKTDGYLPINGTYGCCNFYGPVSTQEEYNVADNAIALFARDLGQPQVARTFATRAQNWQNVYNPGSGFLQPKESSGAFMPGFNPTSGSGFVEADSYVYTAELPFDVRGIINAEGGNAAWVRYLNQMTSNVADNGPTHVQMSNEPSFDIPWEYDYAAAPYKAQQVVREVQNQLYTDSPGGLAGNDDLGAMSSWYVWSAIGGYPETPGSAVLALGSPEFSAVAIHLADGKTITENAPNAADNAPYVHALTMDGQSYGKAYLPPHIFKTGANLDWTLGATPDPAWGSAPADAPPSNTAGLLPALGYLSGTNGGASILQPGTSTTVDLGLQDMSAGPEHVTWTATPSSGSGLQVTPAGGTLTAGPEARTTTPVQVSVPASTPDGRYSVTFSLRTSDGTALPAVVAEVDVARPGDLAPYYNNTGISDDTNQGTANFDGDGFSYSAQALAADHVSPGAAVSSNGVQYVWPDAPAGQPDDVVAGGQTIKVPAVPGASELGLIGSATNGPSTGQMTVTYTDGSSQTFTLGFGDWTLNAGSSSPAYGNATVAAMPYRNSIGGSSQTVKTYVFSANFPVAAGKTVASVTLPSQASRGELHVFTIGTDKGPLTTGN